MEPLGATSPSSPAQGQSTGNPVGHCKLQIKKCPDCGAEIHVTVKTIVVTCHQCGKTFKVERRQSDT